MKVKFVRAAFYLGLTYLLLAPLIILPVPYLGELISLVGWSLVGYNTIRHFGWKGLSIGSVLASPSLLFMLLVLLMDQI